MITRTTTTAAMVEAITATEGEVDESEKTKQHNYVVMTSTEGEVGESETTPAATDEVMTAIEDNFDESETMTPITCLFNNI